MRFQPNAPGTHLVVRFHRAYRLVLIALAAVILATSFSTAGTRYKSKSNLDASVTDGQWETSASVPFPAPIRVDFANDFPPVGVYTTLSTRYDFQNNGGASQYCRVNPLNGNIHVIIMTSDDSLDTSGGASRSTAYAFSSDGGMTWDNFSDVRVPARRAGFPSLTLIAGAVDGAVIANHATVTGVQSLAYLDAPEGTGAFVELDAPPVLNPPVTGGEPIWPMVATGSDGSIILHSSVNNASTGPEFVNRMSNFSWDGPWNLTPTPVGGGGRYALMSNGNGRIGAMTNVVQNGNGIYWNESTDNGATWPATSTVIFPPTRANSNGDSVAAGWGNDFVYDGDTPLMAMEEYLIDAAFPDSAKIVFWSQATGFVTAVNHDTALFINDLNAAQVFHFTLGYPSIGLSGSTIVITFTAFQPQVSSSGFNYGDIWFVKSTDAGSTWSNPVNITQTPNLDERYSSVSKWNAPGEANIVWQEDTEPGSWVRGNGPNTRAKQVFYRLDLTSTSVGEPSRLPRQFTLGQNYPNPFNPSTKIDYSIEASGLVSIRVYNQLGQKVATLVDKVLAAGHYQATFNPEGLAGGVYFYQMLTGGSSQVRKMVYIR